MTPLSGSRANLILLAIGVSLLSACALNYSERSKDPFKELGAPVGAPAYGLVLAQALSETSQNELTNARKGHTNRWMETDRVFEVADVPLARTFKTVVRVAQVRDAQGVNADLSVVLDILPMLLGLRKEVSVRALFQTMEGEVVEELRVRAQGPTSNLLTGTTDKKSLREAALEAARRLEASIANSPKLRSFAAARASARRDSAVNAPGKSAATVRAYHSEVDTPKYSFPESPDRYALVVGIENYAALPPAEFAERDAASVRDHLVALGYPIRNIHFLTGSQASKAGLEKYLDAWFQRNVTESSKVFVYFSGHGAPDTRTGDAYLVPFDGDAKFLEATGYPVRRLYEKLNALRAKEVIVAMDACFSGAGGRSVLPRGTRPLVTRVDDGHSYVGKVVALTASGSDEITGTEEPQGHGLFTYHLLSALNNSKGQATVQAVYQHLLPRVQEGARREHRDQSPQLLPSSASTQAGISIR